MLQLSIPFQYPATNKQVQKDALTRHQHKKEFGVFYTDIELAKDIVRFLKLDKNAVILDAQCGEGHFLQAEQALGYKHVVGCDIDEDAVAACKNKNGFCVFQKDSIWGEADDVLETVNRGAKVDACIGNPPYAKLNPVNTLHCTDSELLQWTKTAGNNLFVAALRSTFNYVKKGGVVSLIVPKSMLYVNAYQQLRTFILQQTTIQSIVDLGMVFKNVRGEQVLITMSHQQPADNKIAYYQYANGQMKHLVKVSQQAFSDTIFFFYHKTDISLYRKFLNINMRLSDFCTGYIGRGKNQSADAVAGKDIRKYGLKHGELPQEGRQLFVQNIYSRESGIIACYGGNLKAGQTITVITDRDKRKCKYLLGLLHSRIANFYLIKYCYHCSSLTMHTDAKYLKKIPIVTDKKQFDRVVALTEELEKTDYLSPAWYQQQQALDALFFDIYQLSEDERNYINLQMNMLQSKKWMYGY